MWHTLRTHAISAHMVMRLLLWKRAITRDPDARTYTDLALTLVRDDDDVTLDLLTKTTGARAAVAHVNKVNKLTRATVEGSHCCLRPRWAAAVVWATHGRVVVIAAAALRWRLHLINYRGSF